MDIKNYFEGGVYFDEGSGYLFDQKGNMIAEVRGWGRIQHLFKTAEEAAQFQDKIGAFIAEAINEKLKK